MFWHYGRFRIWPYHICTIKRKFILSLNYRLFLFDLIINCESCISFTKLLQILTLTVLLRRYNNRVFFLWNCNVSTICSLDFKLRKDHFRAYINRALESSLIITGFYLLLYTLIFHQGLFNRWTITTVYRRFLLDLIELKYFLRRINFLFIVSRPY